MTNTATLRERERERVLPYRLTHNKKNIKNHLSCHCIMYVRQVNCTALWRWVADCGVCLPGQSGSVFKMSVPESAGASHCNGWVEFSLMMSNLIQKSMWHFAIQLCSVNTCGEWETSIPFRTLQSGKRQTDLAHRNHSDHVMGKLLSVVFWQYQRLNPC